MNNRMWNCKNPYQGKTRKVLCVCSAGLLRSPTIANVLYREYGYNTRAVGIDKGHALIMLDEVLIEWADEIIVTENYMIDEIKKSYNLHGKPIFSLDINDSYNYMDEKLQKVIIEKYESQ